MGFTAFDESITRHYHQLGDGMEDLNLNYVLKYMRAYILAARYIADNPKVHTWVRGDENESLWRALYGK